MWSINNVKLHLEINYNMVLLTIFFLTDPKFCFHFNFRAVYRVRVQCLDLPNIEKT